LSGSSVCVLAKLGYETIQALTLVAVHLMPNVKQVVGFGVDVMGGLYLFLQF
jgi:hypothetical protein